MINPAPSQEKGVMTDAKTTTPGKVVEYLLTTLAGYFNGHFITGNVRS